MSVNITTQPNSRGGTYQIADVAFKNNTFQGKVEGKKIMSFGAGEGAFKVLAVAQPGETYEVQVVKNDKGYNDWVSMQKAGVAAGNVSVPQSVGGGKATAATPRSTYETPEERAKRQVLIVRQSSVATAERLLSVGAKAPVKVADVIAVAKELENYIFDDGAGATGFDDVPDFPKEVFPDIS